VLASVFSISAQAILELFPAAITPHSDEAKFACITRLSWRTNQAQFFAHFTCRLSLPKKGYRKFPFKIQPLNNSHRNGMNFA
jgi:hypothetical protein